MTRRWLPVVVSLALIAPAVAAPMASASARAVVADYFADGQLSGAYSIDELRAALVFAQRHQAKSGQYSAFADAVNQAITDALVGSGDAAQGQLTTARTRTEVAPAPAPPAPPAPPSGLPTPPSGAPATSMPIAMAVIAILAGVLLLAGIAASVWRRVRR